MKHSITFELKFTPDSTALMDVTAGLHALKLAPDCLVWSMVPGCDEARVWLTVEGGPEIPNALVDFFRPFPAVNRLIFAPEGRIVLFR